VRELSDGSSFDPKRPISNCSRARSSCSFAQGLKLLSFVLDDRKLFSGFVETFQTYKKDLWKHTGAPGYAAPRKNGRVFATLERSGTAHHSFAVTCDVPKLSSTERFCFLRGARVIASSSEAASDQLSLTGTMLLFSGRAEPDQMTVAWLLPSTVWQQRCPVALSVCSGPALSPCNRLMTRFRSSVRATLSREGELGEEKSGEHCNTREHQRSTAGEEPQQNTWTREATRHSPQLDMTTLNDHSIEVGFMEWAKGAGIETAELSIAHFGREHLRGLRAETALPAGSILARVPGFLALQTRSDDSGRGCPLPEEVCAPMFWKQAPWYARLALLLLFERYKADPESARKLETLVLRRKLKRWEIRPNQRRGPAKVSASNCTLSPWFRLLPTTFDERPLYWTDAERRELQYDCLLRAISEQERKWKDLYGRFVRQTFERGGIDLKVRGGLFSEQDFQWALNVVVTRAFSGPSETTPFGERWRQACFAGALSLASWNFHLMDAFAALNVFLVVVLSQLVFDALYPRIYQSMQGAPLKKYVIAPFIDLFNHSSRVQSKVAYEYFYDAFSLSISNRDTHAGDQVFISYGTLTNDELLALYGFVEEDNPHDTYKLWDDASETTIVFDATGRVRNPESVQHLSATGLIALIREELARKPTTLTEDEQWQPSNQRLELARRFRIGKKRILERALQQLGHAHPQHSGHATNSGVSAER